MLSTGGQTNEISFREYTIPQQKYIVEDFEFDTKFKTEKEIEDLNFNRDNAYGVWDAKGRNEDERINDLFNKVQDYMGVYLTSLSFCNNRPHALTAFK